MRLHPREFIVNRAQAHCLSAWTQACAEVADLDYPREFAALGQVLNALVTGDGVTPPADEPARSMFLALRDPVDGATLTLGEQVSFLGERITSSARYLIRLERHGNLDTAGGVA